MKLYEIIANLKFVGIKNYQDCEIDALTCKSDEKVKDGIYFCIKGTKVDGHDFAETAIKNGAKCLVVERFLDLPITQIKVENVRLAMSYISSIFYGTYKSKMKFIGITGTNGKTTTTFLIREVLAKLNKKVGLIGTEGIYINNLLLPNKLTTPDPIDLHKTIRDMEDNGCEYCVMEVSAHAIALNKIDNIYYDVVGISNITVDHLDFFINLDNYIKCKSSLFSCHHARQGVVNLTSTTKGIVKTADIDLTTIGANGDVKLGDIDLSLKGTDFTFEYKGKKYKAHTNLMGEYNVENVLMAVTILSKLDFSVVNLLNVIKNLEIVVPGRFNVLDVKADYNVVVDFAHTPDGMKKILSTIKKLPIARIITVFGCGGNRDKTKRPEMCKIAQECSDLVVVTSDNPRDENPEIIIADILHGAKQENLVKITDRKSAIEYALSQARTNDVVVILGKGAENYQEIAGIKTHFSDYEVVDNYFKFLLPKEESI